MKIRLNKVTIIVSMFFAYILITTYFLRGESYIIEASEPLKDIVVICHWSSSAFPNLHSGGSHVTKRKGMVVKSGEQFSCGFNWLAGLTLSRPTYNYFRHPTYHFKFVTSREDDVRILKSKNKLQVLDEITAKFNLSEKNLASASKYTDSVMGICGFPRLYIKYYIEVNGEVNVEHFKKSYDADMYMCTTRVYAILKNYHRGFSQEADARKTINNLWDDLQHGRFR